MKEKEAIENGMQKEAFKSDEELKREWEEKLQERGRMLAEEEEARDRRKEKAQRI